jgi:hypothetical protein
MGNIFNGLILRSVKRFFKNTFSQINEVNKKYAEPSIKIGQAAKVALFMLGVYIITILVILCYKFYATVVK